MTSRWEGFGLVLLEANILGIPVLSTRTAGAEEVLGENAAELCGGEGEMGEKAIQLCRDSDVYKVYRQYALSRADKCRNLESYMNIIQELYRNEVEE